MTKIFLLTAPFDEDARTGDGQYAKSLEIGFARHYSSIKCTWLKKINHDYAIPFPAETTSIPEETIPSAIVLQPIANEKTIISGYKLDSALSSPVEAQEVNNITVSPKAPKVIVGHNNILHSLTIMDIFSQKPIKLDELKVKEIIDSLEAKKAALLNAIESNTPTISTKKPNAKLAYLTKSYRENKDNIQKFCTLNEYIEAHLANAKFLDRHKNALGIFTTLKKQFSEAIKLNELEKITDKLTGVKDYVYDFHSNNLPYDLEKDSSFRDKYDFDGLKVSIDTIIIHLKALNSIRESVAERYPHGFEILTRTEAELQDKLALIKLIFDDGFKESNEEEFINALLHPTSIDDVDEAISDYTSISEQLENKQDLQGGSKEVGTKARAKLISELQTIISHQDEPYLSANKNLSGYYGKRKFSASEGFNLAYQANRRDPLKSKLISTLIDRMKPIEDNTRLDIHIRPPDCGVFITPEDIKKLQEAGLKVNLTIHEYKQNYTRRYLQQYTHDLMRQADTVQFFNQMDRDNAIIAATYGDCDKRNTTELTGLA